MTRKRARAPWRAPGYSLLELLATLAVAGMITAVGLPALDTLAMNRRRTDAVSDLMVTLLLARSETARRSRPLIICGAADRDGDGALAPDEQHCSGHDWSDGWIAAFWDDVDGDGAAGPGELSVLRVFGTGTAGSLTVTAGNFTSTPPVGPPGTLVIKSGRRASNGTITVCDRRGPTAARAVIVSSFGRGRVSPTRADGSPLACPRRASP